MHESAGLSPPYFSDRTGELTKRGAKSDAFVRQITVAFGENPGLLPRNFDLEGC